MHVLGCILGAGLLLLITTLIEHNELAYAGTMQESYTHRLSLTLSGMVRNAALLAQGNIFRLSPALGLVFILGSGALFLRRLPQWSLSTVVAVSFLALLLAQCFFINDYPARKLVILLPLVLLTIGAGYTHAASWKPVHKKNLRAMVLLLAALAVIAWQVMAQWRSAQVGSTMVLPTLLPGIVVALVASLIVIYVVKDPARWWWSRWLVLLLVLPGSISSLRYMVMDPSHRYRDTLRSLRDYGSAHFIGGASLGFRTYNQIEPRLDPYLLPGGYNAHWPMLDGMAQQDSTTNYSIGYVADAAAYRSIGFKVDRVLVMDPYETWPERQFVVFKEVGQAH